MLFPMLNVLYFYISTFQIMSAVPSVAVFCSSLISWFPGMLLGYFLNDFHMFPVAPVITGNTFNFTFYMRSISTVMYLLSSSSSRPTRSRDLVGHINGAPRPTYAAHEATQRAESRCTRSSILFTNASVSKSKRPRTHAYMENCSCFLHIKRKLVPRISDKRPLLKSERLLFLLYFTYPAGF
jgi:hypothetical protein